MKNSEFKELIGEIDLITFADEFNKVHTHYVEKLLYYEAFYKNLILNTNFKVFGRNFKDGFRVDEINIIDAVVWKNDEIEHKLSTPKLQSLEKQLTIRLKEIF